MMIEANGNFNAETILGAVPGQSLDAQTVAGEKHCRSGPTLPVKVMGRLEASVEKRMMSDAPSVVHFYLAVLTVYKRRPHGPFYG